MSHSRLTKERACFCLRSGAGEGRGALERLTDLILPLLCIRILNMTVLTSSKGREMQEGNEGQHRSSFSMAQGFRVSSRRNWSVCVKPGRTPQDTAWAPQKDSAVSTGLCPPAPFPRAQGVTGAPRSHSAARLLSATRIRAPTLTGSGEHGDLPKGEETRKRGRTWLQRGPCPPSPGPTPPPPPFTVSPSLSPRRGHQEASSPPGSPPPPTFGAWLLHLEKKAAIR